MTREGRWGGLGMKRGGGEEGVKGRKKDVEFGSRGKAEIGGELRERERLLCTVYYIVIALVLLRDILVGILVLCYIRTCVRTYIRAHTGCFVCAYCNSPLQH